MTDLPAQNDDSVRELLAANLHAVTEEIHTACDRAGRNRDNVRLVAVTKYTPWAAVEQFASLHRVCGESRPQQLAERAPQLPQVEWHLIGQLQRNKVPLALDHAALIHSVDSVRLLERIQAVAESRDLHPRVLLQLNMSHEEAKSGFDAAELRRAWPGICAKFDRVRIEGLMTMAADTDDPETARPVFRQLRQLRDELQAENDTPSDRCPLHELSMGMSGDFQPAIEEGATLIRIGSRLFAGIDARN